MGVSRGMAQEADVDFMPEYIPGLDEIGPVPVNPPTTRAVPERVFDFEEYGETTRVEALAGDNIIFYYRDLQPTVYPRATLLTKYTSHDFTYECKPDVSPMAVMIGPDNTIQNMGSPYVRIDLAGGSPVYLPVKQFIVLLKGAHKEWEIRDTGSSLDRVVLRDTIVDTSKPQVTVDDPDNPGRKIQQIAADGSSTDRLFPQSYDGKPIETESTNRCFVGGAIPVGDIFPVGGSPADAAAALLLLAAAGSAVAATGTPATPALAATPATPAVAAPAGTPAVAAPPATPAVATPVVRTRIPFPVPPTQPPLANRLGRRPPPAVEPVEDELFVGVYVAWGDKVLIFKSGAKAVVPGGDVTEADGTPHAAALRIISHITPTPAIEALKELNREKDDGATVIFYYVVLSDRPTVGPTEAAEAFDFSAAGLEGENAGNEQWWAPITAFRMWLNTEQGTPFNPQSMSTNLRLLAKALGIKRDPLSYKSRPLPTWAAELANEVSSLPNPCKTSEFVTGDCTAKTLKEHVQIGTQEAQEGRLSKRLTDPELREYQRRLQTLTAETDPVKKETLQKEFDKFYPAMPIMIRDPVTNEDHVYILPNPYKAMEVREAATTFADPAGSQNVQIATRLIPSEILADKAMTIAVLESLWFCGQNQTVGDDPRCFPARLLGEFRQHSAGRLQSAVKVEADDILKNYEWPALKLVLMAIKNATSGAGINVRPPVAVEEAANDGAASIVREAAEAAAEAERRARAAALLARAARAATLRTHVTIVPRRLGGYVPVLPGAALGALPPFRRVPV